VSNDHISDSTEFHACNFRQEEFFGVDISIATDASEDVVIAKITAGGQQCHAGADAD
jgi:hypothetical protein